MLEHIDKIIEFVTMLTTILFVICRSNANVKKKIDEHLKPNGGSSVRDALDRIEKKLDLVEATQRALLDLQEESAGHFLSDEKGQLFWVSDIYCSLMEAERDDCLGAKWLKFVATKDQPTVHQHWKLSLDTRSPVDITLNSSESKELRLRAVPVISNTDKLLGFVGNIKPINP